MKFSCRWFALSLLSIFLVTLASCSREDPAIAARRSITASYAALDKAAAEKDVKTYIAQTAPWFQAIQLNGEIWDREKMQQSMHLVYAGAKSIKLKSTVSSFSLLKNGKAKVVVDQTTDAVLPDAATLSLSKVNIVSRSEDTWSQSEGKWSVDKSQVLEMVTTVNGSRIPNPK
jgi:hypothetical protein